MSEIYFDPNQINFQVKKKFLYKLTHKTGSFVFPLSSPGSATE